MAASPIAASPTSFKPRARAETTSANLDQSIDSALDDLEELARKLGEAPVATSLRASCVGVPVMRERREIEFLSLVEILRDVLQKVVQKDDRSLLIEVLGAPYTRLARILYLLEVASLSETRVADSRWTDLKQSCEIIEAVLRDLDGKKFRAWRDLQREGLFKPAFEDQDAASDLGGSDEEVEEAKDKVDDSPRHDSKASRSGMRMPLFCRFPAGKNANFLRKQSVVTRLRDREDQNALTAMIDQAAMLSRSRGLSTEVGRHVHYLSRKVLTSLSDGGCTAMTDLPMAKFPEVGQYAEIAIQAIRDESPLGCLGIGCTALKPEYWGAAKFPKRLDRFPAPSWIFSGPYRGTSRRVFVDGQVSTKYHVDEAEKRWKGGDVVGLLVRLDGRLALYVNGEELIIVAAPGLREHAAHSELFLVVEAYGYVLAVSVVPEADPRKLNFKEPLAPQDPGPLMRRLSNFIDVSKFAQLANDPEAEASKAPMPRSK